MKNKVLASFVLAGIVFVTTTAVVLASSKINLIVNGKSVNADVKIINDQSYVPLRVVSESLGANVKWDGVTKTITINNGIENESPEKVAEKIIRLSSYGQLDSAYELLHPSIRSVFTEEEYTKDRKKSEWLFSSIKDIKIEQSRIIEQWTDEKMPNKITYQNVAEVPFMITYTAMNAERTIRGTMHLIHDDKGNWRFLWWPMEDK